MEGGQICPPMQTFPYCRKTAKNYYAVLCNISKIYLGILKKKFGISGLPDHGVSGGSRNIPGEGKIAHPIYFLQKLHSLCTMVSHIMFDISKDIK